MKIAGVIIAGGGGTRMGGREKLLIRIGRETLLEAILQRVVPQVDVIALNIRSSSAGQYGAALVQDIPILADPFDGAVGPLGGVIAGLSWATTLGEEFEWLASFPGDTPFLPVDLVATLFAAVASDPSRPAVAMDAEGIQSLCAMWPLNCLPKLHAGVAAGRFRSVHRTLESFDGIQCPFENRLAFFNINNPEDVRRAEQIASMG